MAKKGLDAYVEVMADACCMWVERMSCMERTGRWAVPVISRYSRKESPWRVYMRRRRESKDTKYFFMEKENARKSFFERKENAINVSHIKQDN